jgi:hypothetical protein
MIKTLIEGLGLKEPEAKILKNVLSSVGKYENDEIDAALEYANKVLKGYGIEAIRTTKYYGHYHQDIGLLYVNLGDTYKTTLCYEVEKEYFFVSSYGNWVESNMNIVV